ncbi:MAG: cytochrome-c peroxidase, partial [bacterium]
MTDTQEFNSTLLDVVGRIQESDEYVTLFERAFASQGKASVSSTNVNLAISAFLTSLVSMNSRVDRYLRGESAVLTAQERHGMNLFMGKALCATCHFPPTFSGYVPPAFVESESEII